MTHQRSPIIYKTVYIYFTCICSHTLIGDFVIWDMGSRPFMLLNPRWIESESVVPTLLNLWSENSLKEIFRCKRVQINFQMDYSTIHCSDIHLDPQDLIIQLFPVISLAVNFHYRLIMNLRWKHMNYHILWKSSENFTFIKWIFVVKIEESKPTPEN